MTWALSIVLTSGSTVLPQQARQALNVGIVGPFIDVFRPICSSWGERNLKRPSIPIVVVELRMIVAAVRVALQRGSARAVRRYLTGPSPLTKRQART